MEIFVNKSSQSGDVNKRWRTSCASFYCDRTKGCRVDSAIVTLELEALSHVWYLACNLTTLTSQLKNRPNGTGCGNCYCLRAEPSYLSSASVNISITTTSSCNRMQRPPPKKAVLFYVLQGADLPLQCEAKTRTWQKWPDLMTGPACVHRKLGEHN